VDAATAYQSPLSESPPAPSLPASQSDLYPKLDEKTVIEEFQRRASASAAHSKDWRDEAKELYDFVAGRQWDADDEAKMKEQNRPMVTFNLVAKFLDAVAGLQINNRQEIRCYPRRPGAAQVSEIANGALSWCRDQCGAEYEETDAGHDCLLVGMGWIEDFYDDTRGPEATIAQERRDCLEMLWDPTARKKNLTDRRWQARLKRMTRDEYIETFGEEPTGSVAVAGLSADDIDAGVQVINKPQNYTGDDRGGSDTHGQFMVADYQFWCLHPVWDVQANIPGVGPQSQRFSHEEWQQLSPQLVAAGIQHEAARSNVRQHYRCWITGDGIKNGIRLLPTFTYHAITGKRDRNKNLWYGLGRNLKDPQRWVNAFFSSIIWQLMVNPKGGVMMEENAVTDQAEFEDSWADPSKVSWLADGALVAGKVQAKPAATYPQGMDRLMTFSLDALPGVSGINAELLGLTDRQQPGVVEAQRKQGALAIVAWYFDALRRYYQEAGRVMLGMIRDFLADGRLIRIVGKEGAQYVPLLKDPLTAQYDIVVDEAPTSVNMQERVWAVIQQLLPLAVQAGVRIPPEVWDYAPIPPDLAQALKQQLQMTPQQQQEQQIQKGLMAAAQQAKTAKDQAQAAEAQAGAQLKNVQAQEIAVTAPTSIALDQVETIRKAAEAGSIQAGGLA
jgi:hypothetical protein